MKLDEPKKLGLNPVSPESEFRIEASTLLRQNLLLFESDDRSKMESFWRTLRTLALKAGQSTAARVIPSLPWRLLWIEENLYSELMDENKEGKELLPAVYSWHNTLLLRTIAGSWEPFSRTLLPGPIVQVDGSRDGEIAIDVDFHKEDLPLLRTLGAVDAPVGGYELLPQRRYHFLRRCRDEYLERDDLPHKKPHPNKLNFDTMATSGPLEVLKALSDEGNARYTWDLLDLDDTYKKWTMQHDGSQSDYPQMEFDSPALEVLREHGRIRTDAGIQKLSAGLGSKPADPDVLMHLLKHPKARLIRHAFDLEPASDPTLEPSGEDDPIPLLDIWPGLGPHLSQKEANFQLIRCNDLKNRTGRIDGTITDRAVYIARRDDGREGLRVVLRMLGLQLAEEQAEAIFRRETPADIRAARDKIRACPTDEERLLAAVGEADLKHGLPNSLKAVLERIQGDLAGLDVARAAIATFHTGALREYRSYLDRLRPPKNWAGTAPAIEFVRSLGFADEWAGERSPRRESYIEVEGPYSLPKLHDYQREIVRNVRSLIQSDSERRGMISLPTGSGKTRVAVQAIVEAIRCDGFQGDILWVADRDELCEQAVESWRRVWSNEGVAANRLRISKMWDSRPSPSPTSNVHVIVATIQTLKEKVNRQNEPFELLADFKLVVFDEAHRSLAPTFTSVMEKLGLTRRRRAHEPILLGLTATPYRRRDEEETRRLVRRYGGNRLDSGAFASDDPEVVIQELQREGILALVDHDTIEGGCFSLSKVEERLYEQSQWLPQTVENRIASDTNRTLRIVEAYRNRVDPGWPTLIFGTSVEHSQTVAALLTSKGVRARAVSANTDTASRRRIVEEFREGDIKALVNYGIFREGFDAPKTRAIIVARPVYSPNLYFQMIGRGLRGTKNGGNDRCLILNVEDNIENFQRKLAFSDLDWLWA